MVETNTTEDTDTKESESVEVSFLREFSIKILFIKFTWKF